MDAFRRKLIDWRKTFAPRSPDKLDDVLSASVFLDEFYCRELLKAVPDIVARTRNLSALTLDRVERGESFVYLREAANCYILGLTQAAIALARAAIENSLRKATAKLFGDATIAATGLKALIDDFAKRGRLLSREGHDLAHQVRRAGDDVLHDKSAESTDALAIVEAARAVVLELSSR